MTSATPPVEEICDGDGVIAVIVRAAFSEPGVRFFSRDKFSQQLGSIRYPSGHRIPPHVHNPVQREVVYTQETLFIRSGRVHVDLYRSDQTWLASRELGPGDVILLATGGHGFEVIEECSMIEVKQGPYAGDGDKTRFDPAG
jgi:mannose-6-phosphate isomerase-like protein (cupin superfamily)